MSDIISQMGGLADTFLSKHASKLSKKIKSLFIETLILFVVMQKTNIGLTNGIQLTNKIHK